MKVLINTIDLFTGHLQLNLVLNLQIIITFLFVDRFSKFKVCQKAHILLYNANKKYSLHLGSGVKLGSVGLA